MPTDLPSKLAVTDTAPQRPSDQSPMQRDIRERLVRLCEAVLWHMARRRMR